MGSVYVIDGMARGKAVAHVLDVLSYAHFLSDYVRARADFRRGTFSTVDPAGRCPDQVENLAWGAGAGCDNEIGQRLLKSLVSSPGRFLVIDDVMGDPSDTTVSSSVNDGEIFHWIDGGNATELELTRLVWATGVSWHFLGVIFSGDAKDIPQCIAAGRCAELGDIVEVIVGAYDGEGFIHWLPD